MIRFGFNHTDLAPGVSGQPCHANGRYGRVVSFVPDGVQVALFDGLPPAQGQTDPPAHLEIAAPDQIRILDPWWAFHCANGLGTTELGPVIETSRRNATRYEHKRWSKLARGYLGPKFDAHVWRSAKAISALIRADVRAAVRSGELPDWGYSFVTTWEGIDIRTASYRAIRKTGVLDSATAFVPAGDQAVRHTMLRIAFAYGAETDRYDSAYRIWTDGWLADPSDVYGPSPADAARLRAERDAACRDIEVRHPYPTLAELIREAADAR